VAVPIKVGKIDCERQKMEFHWRIDDEYQETEFHEKVDDERATPRIRQSIPHPQEICREKIMVGV